MNKEINILMNRAIFINSIKKPNKSFTSVFQIQQAFLKDFLYGKIKSKESAQMLQFFKKSLTLRLRRELLKS